MNDTHVRISAENRQRFISAPAIDDDDISRPLKLVERAPDVRSFIVGQDDRGDFLKHKSAEDQRSEGGRQKAEGGRRKAEGRRQKAEGRRQKAEGRRQKAEGRRQKIFHFPFVICHFPILADSRILFAKKTRNDK